MNETSANKEILDISAEMFLVKEGDLSVVAETLSGNEARLAGPVERPGWYIGRTDAASRNNAPSENSLWLGTFPREGLAAYLASSAYRGIGEKTAEKIAEEPDDGRLLAMLRGNDEALKAHDIPENAAKTLKSAWMAGGTGHALSILMFEMGLAPQQRIAVAEKLGSAVITELGRNPYGLLDRLPRLDFEQVTAFCIRFGIEVTDEAKALAAVDFWLGRTERDRGHTCAPFERVLREASNLANLDRQQVSGYVTAKGDSYDFGERREKSVLSTRRSAKLDAALVVELARISGAGGGSGGVSLGIGAIETTFPLSDEQVDAINISINNPVSIVTGGPGAGKTTLVQGLANELAKMRKEVRICAPTGRAAKRIAETPGLDAFDPSTIHMYLARNQHQGASQDVMIVDESSMIDRELMVGLLSSIPGGCSIVFIGDPDQLRPVGPGQPFKDMIDSDTVPVARLTGNFRQDDASDTVTAAESLIHGKVPDLDGNLGDSDFVFIEEPASRQAEAIMELYFDTLPSMLGNKSTDNQILAPQRTKHLGIYQLNELVQSRLFPDGKPLLERKDGMRVHNGDKVINLENNYDLGVMNGDVGTVVNGGGRRLSVEFEMPGGGVQEADFSGIDRYNLEPAYAITIHKSQGSEYPGVIIPVTPAHGYMLSRSLLYTAITRGKRKVVLVGERAAFEKAIEQYAKDFRYTLLRDALTEKLPPRGGAEAKQAS